MDQRTLQVCNNIKAAGIIVYTVAFQIPGDEAGALDLLNSCASDKDKYFAPGTEANSWPLSMLSAEIFRNYESPIRSYCCFSPSAADWLIDCFVVI